MQSDERTFPVDVFVGASALAGGAVVVLARRARPVVEPVVRIMLRPPVLPTRLQPAQWLDLLGRRGAELRTSSRQQAPQILDVLVPVVVEEVLRRIDLTAMISKYVDLDRVVAGVDVGEVASRIDVDAVARRLDMDAVLDRIDITAVVLERVDLDAVVKAALGTIDLVGLTQQIIDEIDLPEIIRASTGSMASETVQGARMQGIVADEAVGRLVDRLLRRNGQRPRTTDPDAPAEVRESDEAQSHVVTGP
jgi:hypothetical protein